MSHEIEIPKFVDIDKKQQKIWADKNLFASPVHPTKKKFYCLDMFPYPSGDGACRSSRRLYGIRYCLQI